MSVWKMNLIDNRECSSNCPKDEKFNFCKDSSIIGIGWVGYEDDEELKDDASYKKAKNAFLSLKIGDFVWVKNPLTQNYYICKIKSLPEYKGDQYKDHDIGYCCSCEYYFVGTSDKLPNEISSSDLISISTITKASEDIEKNTIAFSKKVIKFDCKKVLFIKKTIFPVIGFALVVLIGIILSVKSNSTKSFKSKEAMFNCIQGVYQDFDTYYVIKEENLYIFKEYIVEDFIKEYAKKDNIEKINYTDILDKFEKYAFADPVVVEKIDYKNGKIILQRKSNDEEYIGVYKDGLKHKDYFDDSKDELDKINDSTRLDIEELEERFEEEKAKIIKFNKSAKAYIPTFSEYGERLRDAYPELKEWPLYSDTNGEKIYAKNGNTNNGVLASTSVRMLLINRDQNNLQISLNKVDGKNNLVILCDSSLNESILKYVDVFLGNYPDKLSISEMLNNFSNEGTVSYGEKVYKKVVGDVDYKLYEKVSGSSCRVIIQVK